MAGYKQRVISLTKKPGHTFGFYLRVEQGEEGHLIRCLEMGGPAELAGMKDGDRILRVNGTFVDELSHSEVVDIVRDSGATVSFHILDEASYKQAKDQGVSLSSPPSAPVTNGPAKPAPQPKLCYLVKSSSGYGFSLCSIKGERGFSITEVIPGGVAHRAGVRAHDYVLEINGENIEGFSHDQAVAKMKAADSRLMLLLADEETYKHYQDKRAKIEGWMATTKYLPHQPRIAAVTKGSDGYGFLLREEHDQKGHFIRNIDRGSPADRAGLQDMDKIVAVDGKEVDDYTHEQVVEAIRKSGGGCSLLVVDKMTDQMYKQGKVSPMLFCKDMKDSNPPPSYTEAINLPAPIQLSTRIDERTDNLKPKLCKLQKTSAGYGFHLNGIQGLFGQHIREVVKDGAADRSGVEDLDVLVEVNGVNVEWSTHEEVVTMIKNSGSSLELLVATKSVYEQLKARGVPVTRQLLGETSQAEVHAAHTPEMTRREEARPETPTEPARERASSSSSEDSVDERF